MKHWMSATLVAVALAGCQDAGSGDVPEAIALTEEAAGHYCQMVVLEHPGPKGQVHLDGFEFPLWFSQVRDAIAFDRMPERIGDVRVIYVNDMGVAPSWDAPGTTNWIDARTAYFVHGSAQRGGMGAPEFVPFADAGAADRFAALHGGSVIRYDDVTAEMVLTPVDIDTGAAAPPAHGDAGHGDAGPVDGTSG